MRVTGIMICKNQEEIILTSIKSFLDQEYVDKKLIVISNGLVHKSWESIKENNTIEVFSFDQPYNNSFVKNFALERFYDDTDIFAFPDPQAYYLSGKISKSVDILKGKCGHPGIIYSDYYTYKANSNFTNIQYMPAFSKRLLSENKIDMSNVLISKEVFNKVGKFDESISTGEDIELVMRASSKFMTIHIPEPLVTKFLT